MTTCYSHWCYALNSAISFSMCVIEGVAKILKEKTQAFDGKKKGHFGEESPYILMGNKWPNVIEQWCLCDDALG